MFHPAEMIEFCCLNWIALLFFLLITITICYYFRLLEPSGLPPGPTRFPIFGNLPQFDIQSPHETFFKWTKQYGPIYRIYVASKLSIVINDYELLKSALSGPTGEITAGKMKQKNNCSMFNVT